MASRIDPKPKKSKQTPPAANVSPAKPAAAKPAATPSAPPPLAGKPGVAVAGKPADHADDHVVAAGLKRQMPGWAISGLVHVVALLAMALIVTQPEPPPEPPVLTFAPIDEEANQDQENDDSNTADAPTPTVDPTPVEAKVTDPEVVNEPTDLTTISPPIDLEPPSAAENPPIGGEMPEIGVGPIVPTGSGVFGTGKSGPKKGPWDNRPPPEIGNPQPGPKEEAVDRALKWFIAHQLADGGWSFDLGQCPQCGGKCSHGGEGGHAQDRYAATSMALLTFLGRGHTHKEGPYKKQLEAGIGFLAKKSAASNGQCYDKGSLYTQGLAGIALCEAYGMTQDNRLQAPAQLALDFIMSAQHEAGGWRYQPKQAGDTSVVGWQIMALKSGHMAYLNVDPDVIKRATKFLDSVQGDEYGSSYGYAGPGKGPATTAVGLLCRMYLGWKKDEQGLQQGTQAVGQMGPKTDLYYSYYATQVMHHMGGDLWKKWDKDMRDLLLPLQATEGHERGSWYDGVNDGHGGRAGGRLYCTALAALMLEAHYRHMPIYRNEAMEDEFRE